MSKSLNQDSLPGHPKTLENSMLTPTYRPAFNENHVFFAVAVPFVPPIDTSGPRLGKILASSQGLKVQT
jgi:hypothetical protein